ncbi:MAG: hypothetical protein LBS18_05745 [Clostridiales bacterium]|jgi:hypothetical protein|nr:hypothetical protein [Clostridiales bacterium]
MSVMEEYLYDAIRRGSVPHAVCITGPAGSDAGGVARRAAALYLTGRADESLLTACPDYHELGAAQNGVNDIRDMQGKLIPQPFYKNRAVVILEAMRLTVAAQNALLKTLEEPPHDTMLFLAGREEGLLPTIRSRCMFMRLSEVPERQIYDALIRSGYGEKAARVAAAFCGGAPLLAVKMAQEPYTAFFEEAAGLFFTTLTAPLPPYAQARQLLERAAFLDEPRARTQTEERRRTLGYALAIWQILAMRMLYGKLGMPPAPPEKLSRQVADACASFTTGQIQGIMNEIISAQKRNGAANPALTFDALISALNVR